MNRDKLADWLHCLQGGMYDWVQEEIEKELAKPLPQPVAWVTTEQFASTAHNVTKVSLHQEINGIPLYALEVTK